MNGGGLLQRYDIVNGVSEVEGVTTEAATEKEEDKEANGTVLIFVGNFNDSGGSSFLTLKICYVFLQKRVCLISG